MILSSPANFFFFFQAEDGIRELTVTGVQTCALPIVTGALFVDRAELLLSLRLIDEARSAADRAVDLQRRHSDQLRLPRAQLLLSTVALVQGDLETAVQAADQAIRG